jgi:hypothetical protein
MTRTTNRPPASVRATRDDTDRAENVETSFVSWAPSDVERARDRAARRGEIDTARVRGMTDDDPRAAFVRALRALGLNACANVMGAKAA